MFRPAKVLVVEDNDGDIRLVQEALKQTQSTWQVSVVRDGIAAIEHLRHEPGARNPPDLILLDLNIPFKDGREVLREIKDDDNLKHIPVLILTSSCSPDDVMSAYRLHANCYLTKPARLNDLFSLVESIQEFWTRRAHLPLLAGSD